jgi:hypothetical protein
MVSVTADLELVDDVLLDEELHAASASAAAATAAAPATARFLFKMLTPYGVAPDSRPKVWEAFRSSLS